MPPVTETQIRQLLRDIDAVTQRLRRLERDVYRELLAILNGLAAIRQAVSDARDEEKK
jgi:hypothetical protein